MSFELYDKEFNPTQPIVGLFGSCGDSQWRDEFIKMFKGLGIQWFNPNKENWSMEDAKSEEMHLLADDIVCFPVLGETFGSASLAESSLSIMRAVLDRKTNKFTIILIEDIADSLEEANPQAFKESRAARAIIKRHLQHVAHDRVFIVETLGDMLEVVVSLHSACLSLNSAKQRALNHQDIFGHKIGLTK